MPSKEQHMEVSQREAKLLVSAIYARTSGLAKAANPENPWQDESAVEECAELGVILRRLLDILEEANREAQDVVDAAIFAAAKP
jgi:hypothetical protein